MTSQSALIQAIYALSMDASEPGVRELIEQTFRGINQGHYRAAEPDASAPEGWKVNPWVKKTILLAIRLFPSHWGCVEKDAWNYYDKFPLKTADWGAQEFQSHEIRALPGSIIRAPSFVGKKVIIMPSFINMGAFVDDETLIDTWATVGSCAQIGKRVHLSGGTGIGGVLEPMQGRPVIIEDDCFIGARCEIAEGVIIKKGSVIAMGTMLGGSTVLIDRETGKTLPSAVVPPYSVVVPGSRPSRGGINLSCAVIVKKVDARTRAKTSINQLLRKI